VGQVVEVRQEGETFADKQLAGVKYEDVTISVDLSLDPVFYTWISDTLERKNLRRDVTVLSLDPNLKVRDREDFFNALITEITFPALDGSSKEAAFLTIKFSPEYTRNQKGDGSKFNAPVAAKKKAWSTQNFRLTLDGLDCSKATMIESFSIRQQILEDHIGAGREHGGEPTLLDVGNLGLSITESGAQDFIAWHEDFVINGNSSSDKEKSGALTYLASDLKTVLGEVSFSRIGIFRLSRGFREALADRVPRIQAELYVEQIGLTVGSKP
jgi:hypothetical protein